MKIYPLKPLRVANGFLVVDQTSPWRIAYNRQRDKIHYKMFRTKCKIGLLKNKFLARLK